MDNTDLYGIKMRASQKSENTNRHLSGAERIVEKENIISCANSLIKRALNHENGKADFINLKIENINREKVLELEALPVILKQVKTKAEGYKQIEYYLKKNGIEYPKKVINMLKECKSLRGAILLDVNTLKRLEPNPERGVRATYMDSDKFNLCTSKNHFNEAIILATKVANAPNIVGEICISDDINYVTGYFASKRNGYIRISKLKEKGDPLGGRIFLYNGKTKKDLENTIDFIEKQPVIVTNIANSQINTNKWEFIEEYTKNIKKENLYRTQNEILEINKSNVKIGNTNFKMFSSNNYLGFANNDEIKKFSAKMLKKYGTGTGGSRLICGNFDLHTQLENKIAKFKNQESAIIFNSGYVTNLTVIPSLFKENDVIFSDELNHASIIDGCRLSKAKTIIFKHADYVDLEEKIKKNAFNKGVIISDAVFSMDGDIADLPKILLLSKKYNLLTYIDEAHSTGVIGKTGRGIVEYYNLNEYPDIIMGTLSKALGAEGGFITGSKLLTDYLRNSARGYIFSTAFAAAPVAAAIKGLELLENDVSYVKKLHENIRYFNKCLHNAGINVSSKTSIFSFIIGDENKALEAAKKLLIQKFFIKAIRYPTVPKGQARLRIVITSQTLKKDMKQLSQILGKIL